MTGRGRRTVWQQMVRDKFLWVVGLTVCVSTLYGIAPQIRDILN